MQMYSKKFFERRIANHWKNLACAIIDLALYDSQKQFKWSSKKHKYIYIMCDAHESALAFFTSDLFNVCYQMSGIEKDDILEAYEKYKAIKLYDKKPIKVKNRNRKML